MAKLTRRDRAALLDAIESNPSGGYYDAGCPIADLIEAMGEFPTRAALKQLESEGDVIFVTGDRVKSLRPSIH